MDKSKDILKKYWGYDNFRPLQEDIVDSVIYGHDTFAMLPTGGGKSICFQIPGLALEGITIVISPLIALMQDQVNTLTEKGINATLLTSSMSYREIDITLDNAKFGDISFLYTSPERLKSPLFIERFKQMNVSLIVVDEAHCISEWGHDFRPSYRQIKDIKEYHPKAPIVALTASATKKVQEDIITQLDLKSPKIFKGNIARNNISYQVQASENKIQSIINFCNEKKDLTGIVYCQTRRSVKEIVLQLRSQGINAGVYHGGLKHEDRTYMLESWMNGSIKVMVATNAFGMGIDKSDVRYVLHYQIPNNLEAYYQEAGRAGRDEKSAQAIAFWEPKDITLMQQHLKAKYPPKERILQVYNSVYNFLKIAIGAGIDETYTFDIRAFSKTFSIPIGEAYFALKVLELNENLTLSENNFFPTRLRIAIGKSSLYKFQVTHSNTSDLITLLSRSYPGIFDRYIYIHENELAKRLKITEKELLDRLKHMEQFGVIEIRYQTSLPQISFTTERLPDSHFNLKNEIYHTRKEVESNKLNAMISYITDTTCRSQSIANYFNSKTEVCGICDVCIEEKNNVYKTEELSELILSKLPKSLDQLSKQLNVNKSSIQKALHFLILEEKIQFNNLQYELLKP